MSRRSIKRAERKKQQEEAKAQEKKAKQDGAKATKGLKTDAREEADVATKPSPKSKFFGDNVEPDFGPGTQAVTDCCRQPCMWDEQITYSMQLDIMMALQRITEHFSAAAMSSHMSKPFDVVCVTVLGCITALADAVLRKLALDGPSEVCEMARTLVVTN